MIKRSIVGFILIVLFTSCSSVRYLGIDTYNPAEVTFPDYVDKLLIVQNAVPQPPTTGYEYTHLGVLQDTCRANADSALYYACHSLGKAILQEEYFNDVLLYNSPLRTDNQFLIEQKLSPEQVSRLCDETGASAVISLDRLLFTSKRTDTSVADYLQGDIKVEMTGIFRAYVPRQSAPLAAVMITDSVFWSETADDMVILNVFLPTPDEMLSIAAVYLGDKIHSYFVPHWGHDTRWYYTGINTQWKEASAYIQSGKWEQASTRWENIHARSSKWETKAKTAANVALCKEMTGQFEEALKWAQTASDLYKAHTADDDRNRQLLAAYVEALGERIKANKKLDEQIGVE